MFQGADVRTFTAYIEWYPETLLYVGVVPGVPGAHTQASGLGELRDNLREVLELCLSEMKAEGTLGELPQFVGLQQIVAEV